MATSTQISVYSIVEDDTNLLPKYNGEEFKTPINVPYLVNGRDYVWQVMLAQRDLSGTNNLYDIPVCRGAIPLGVSDPPSTTLFVDKDLPIYEWGYNGNDETSYPTGANNVIYAGMVVEVNGERRFIQSYKPRFTYGEKVYGYITLESPFTSNPPEGARYQIYSNYLISPQYFFMSRALPTSTLSIEYTNVVGNNIELTVSGTYAQANDTPIKYYSIALYVYAGNVDSTSANLYLISESPKIFSQKIEYTFKYCNVGMNPWNGEQATYMNYRAVVTIVTQDNVVYTPYVSMRDDGVEESAPTEREFEWNQNNSYGCLECNYSTTPSDEIVIQYRKDLNTGKVVQLPYWYYDFTVSTKGKYEYITIYRNRVSPYPTYCNSIGRYRVETNMDGYFITALEKNGERYEIGDTWKFICDIDDSTITQNTNKILHVGYNRYPSMSSTNLNYMTGTLSGMIGSLNCCDKQFHDDITLVNAWREFITQPHPYLLKSQKGDVWIVNITGNPKTDYQEDYYKVPTRFTIEWAECDNVDEAYIECNRELDNSECPQTHA